MSIGILLLKGDKARFRDALERFRRYMAVVGVGVGLPPSAPSPSPSPPSPPSQPGSGRVTSRYGTPPADLEAAIMRYFPESQWRNAADIAYLESGNWTRTAVRDTRDRAGGQCGVRIFLPEVNMWGWTEWSIGYFQINACAHGGDYGTWADTDNNVRKAAELWRSEGWSPWLISARTLGLL